MVISSLSRSRSLAVVLTASHVAFTMPVHTSACQTLSKLTHTQPQQKQELTEGLRVYFDRALPLTLLYRQEKEQFERAKKAFGGMCIGVHIRTYVYVCVVERGRGRAAP